MRAETTGWVSRRVRSISSASRAIKGESARARSTWSNAGGLFMRFLRPFLGSDWRGSMVIYLEGEGKVGAGDLDPVAPVVCRLDPIINGAVLGMLRHGLRLAAQIGPELRGVCRPAIQRR